MSNKIYSISPAKIGNQDGFRFPRAFSKEYPHLVQASGQVEVINEDTLLIRLDPQQNPEEDDEEEDSLMMSLFLDFLMKDALKHPEKLVPLTEEMCAEIDELFADANINLEDE